MFGNQKMYKRGLADSLKAVEGFSEKQQAALEKLRQEVASGGKRLEDALAGLGDELNGIYDYLNGREKAALYRLETPMDLKELEAPERQLLIAVLYQLADDEGDRLTDDQRAFIRSVQRYLEVTNPQTSADLAVVGDIDSLDVQKAFLRVALEFFYLQEEEELTPEQVEFLDNFSVNKKQAVLIEHGVSRLYNAVGPKGVAEKYGYVPEPEEREETKKGDGAKDPEEPIGLLSPVTESVTLDGSESHVPEGEEKTFEGLRLVFPTQFKVDGKVVFNNCQIVLSSRGDPAIWLGGNSEAEFCHCEFITEKAPSMETISVGGTCVMRHSVFSGLIYQTGETERKDNKGNTFTFTRAFIDVDGYEDAPAALTMEHCLVENCAGTFISADGNAFGSNHKVTLSGCQVTGHAGNFLLARYAYKGGDTGVFISGCDFTNCWQNGEEKEENLLPSLTESQTCLLIISCEPGELTGSRFRDIDENVFGQDDPLGEGSIPIKKCEFSRFKQKKPIFGAIDGCLFEEFFSDAGNAAPGDPFGALEFGCCKESLNDEILVRNSVFRNITGKIALEFGKIEHCRFERSTLRLLVLGKGGKEGSYRSEANDLTFENCSVLVPARMYDFYDTPAFIQALSYLDQKEPCVSINGCKFKSCVIPKGCKAVNVVKKELGAFGRVKTYVAGSERNTRIK